MTLIVAGATGYGIWPANTLEGAAACLETRVDGIEIDVQLTSDGHVVAHHDYWLSRHAKRLDGAWLEARGPALKTMTLAELSRYDVGTLRPGSSYAERYPGRAPMDGARVPTLPQILELLRDAGEPRRWIYVEIKTDPQDPEASPDFEAITRATLGDLEAAGWTDRSKIIAFDWRVLRLTKALRPGIATAHLTVPAAMAGSVRPLPNGDSPWVDDFDPRRFGGSELAALKAHGGSEWSPHLSDVTPERLAEARELGLHVGPWGVSSAEEIRRMISEEVYSVTVSGPDWGPGPAVGDAAQGG
ncbi:MAG TPA: glycerophosphodiester phosphodiesterase family protein [Caulobacteraceae bacterium]|jgi:glycerophosphoryl diester phosphodiesterase